MKPVFVCVYQLLLPFSLLAVQSVQEKNIWALYVKSACGRGTICLAYIYTQIVIRWDGETRLQVIFYILYTVFCLLRASSLVCSGLLYAVILIYTFFSCIVYIHKHREMNVYICIGWMFPCNNTTIFQGRYSTHSLRKIYRSIFGTFFPFSYIYCISGCSSGYFLV